MRKHTIWQDGKQTDVLFTSEEEAEQDTIEAQVLEEKPMRNWLEKMQESDTIISRTLEDLIDIIEAKYGESMINKHLKSKLNNKKLLRSTRP